MWIKHALLCSFFGEKRCLKSKKELDTTFTDVAPFCSQSSVAVEQVEEPYHETWSRDTLENDGNTWKVEQYLQSLCKSHPSIDF